MGVPMWVICRGRFSRTDEDLKSVLSNKMSALMGVKLLMVIIGVIDAYGWKEINGEDGVKRLMGILD